MSWLVPLAARAARHITARQARLFEAALETPDAAQERVLRRFVGALCKTDYGRAHGITPATGYRDFARKLPIVRYIDLEPYIARMQAGDANILWPGRPRFWHRTSGSGGPAKDIPVSKDLSRVFAGMADIWINDLLARQYRPRTGKIFVSISPPSSQPYPEDTAYLSAALGLLVRRLVVAPAALKRIQDSADFRLALACVLVAEADLEVFSLWNPSYLIVLTDLMAGKRAAIAVAFDRGILTIGDVQLPLPRLSPERLAALMRDPIDCKTLWPRLQLVSCWDSAAASAPASRIRRMLPAAFVQGKGLMATEAPVTLPLVDAPGPVPLLDSVFLEFRGEDGVIRHLHEVGDGETHEVIVSPLGGFARYALGDKIRVAGRHRKTPCLSFAGRADAISDLVGEKLSEDFVAEILARLLGGGYGVLVPSAPGQTPAIYTLLADIAAPARAEDIDRALQSAHHYRLARSLGQLGPVKMVRQDRLRERMLAIQEQSGAPWGHLKDRALIVDDGLAATILSRLTMQAGKPPPV